MGGRAEDGARLEREVRLLAAVFLAQTAGGEVPHGVDWQGREFPQSVAECRAKHPGITAASLLQLAARFVASQSCPASLLALLQAAGRLPGAGGCPARNSLSRSLSTPLLPRLSRPLSSAISTGCYGHAVQLVKALKGHSAPVYRLIYDYAGHRFLSGGDDNLVKIWYVVSLVPLLSRRRADAHNRGKLVSAAYSLLPVVYPSLFCISHP